MTRRRTWRVTGSVVQRWCSRPVLDSPFPRTEMVRRSWAARPAGSAGVEARGAAGEAAAAAAASSGWLPSFDELDDDEDDDEDDDDEQVPAADGTSSPFPRSAKATASSAEKHSTDRSLLLTASLCREESGRKGPL